MHLRLVTAVKKIFLNEGTSAEYIKIIGLVRYLVRNRRWIL